MRREISEKIEIPEGINVEVTGEMLKFKKADKEISRKYSGFSIKKENNALILHSRKGTKNEKKMINTTKAHIKNILSGLNKNFIYKLQICSVHFPMAVSVDKEKKEVLIKNFLGEAKPRKARILNNVEVKVDKEIVIVESYDKELAGQTVANIERATKIRNRDRTRFQDGIFITEKPGEGK